MNDTILLNNYFNGLLSSEEARDVEARAASDPVFMEEFTLRKEMEAFPRKEAERAAFMATLKTIRAEYLEEKVAETPRIIVARNNVRQWLALAASVTLLAAAIWFFTRPGMPNYEQYAQHTPLSLTVMGETEQAKTEAETAFNQRDYVKALASLDQVLRTEPDNLKVTYYRGICLLELGRAAEARAVFEPLVTGNSAFQEDAIWYVALSYLQEKNMASCKIELTKIKSGEAHYKEAQEILERLK